MWELCIMLLRNATFWFELKLKSDKTGIKLNENLKSSNSMKTKMTFWCSLNYKQNRKEEWKQKGI